MISFRTSRILLLAAATAAVSACSSLPSPVNAGRRSFSSLCQSGGNGRCQTIRGDDMARLRAEPPTSLPPIPAGHPQR